MKIGIPTQNNRASEAEVSRHFGRAPYFAVADTETGEVEIVPNEGCGHGHGRRHRQGDATRHQHGHGHGHRRGDRGLAGWVGSLGVDAVACRTLGPGALASLGSVGIDVFKSSESTVASVVAEIREGNAERFDAEGVCAGGHHHGQPHMEE